MLLFLFNPNFPPLFSILKMSSAVYIQVRLRLDFFMEANNMSPDQTAPWDLGLLFLQYRLPKNRSRQEEQMVAWLSGP